MGVLSDTKIGLVISKLAKNSDVQEFVRDCAHELLVGWRTMHRNRKPCREDAALPPRKQSRTVRDDNVSAKNDSSSTASQAVWRCGRCTFDYPAGVAACQACDWQ